MSRPGFPTQWSIEIIRPEKKKHEDVPQKEAFFLAIVFSWDKKEQLLLTITTFPEDLENSPWLQLNGMKTARGKWVHVPNPTPHRIVTPLCYICGVTGQSTPFRNFAPQIILWPSISHRSARRWRISQTGWSPYHHHFTLHFLTNISPPFSSGRFPWGQGHKRAKPIRVSP